MNVLRLCVWLERRTAFICCYREQAHGPPALPEVSRNPLTAHRGPMPRCTGGIVTWGKPGRLLPDCDCRPNPLMLCIVVLLFLHIAGYSTQTPFHSGQRVYPQSRCCRFAASEHLSAQSTEQQGGTAGPAGCCCLSAFNAANYAYSRRSPCEAR